MQAEGGLYVTERLGSRKSSADDSWHGGTVALERPRTSHRCIRHSAGRANSHGLAYYGGSAAGRTPCGPAREAAANWALAKGEDFWEKRASEQVNLTYYRLVFRSFFYAPPPVRGDLPFPPHAAWRFEILDEPRRMQIGTHDYVAVPYHFWPLRDCGFTPPSKVYSCAAGSMVKLSCKTSGSKQVLRVCGIPCTYLNSASNTIIDGDCETVTFSCPAVRDTAVAGTGAYSLSQAPLLPSGSSDPVSCTQN